MTREDAIRWMTVLKQSKINWIGGTNKIADIKVECEKAEQEAFDMAIEALVQDSRKVTQESDLIRRSDAINCVGWGDSVTTVIDRIKALPSAETEQVTGKLKNPCDSLLTDNSDECKEQKSTLDLISKQDIIGYIDRVRNSGLGKNKALEYISKYVERVPSAEAVEVVRCKDCKHAEDDITYMFCVYFHHKVYGDDYCSNAVKRREDGEA